jgi:hypothetical protein
MATVLQFMHPRLGAPIRQLSTPSSVYRLLSGLISGAKEGDEEKPWLQDMLQEFRCSTVVSF